MSYRFFLFFFFITSFNPVFSQNNYRYEIGIQNDNDAYLMILQDRYYTNGIDAYFKKAVDSSKFSTRLENVNWSINVGHKIYNAHTGAIDKESQVDRPLTGYLYLSGEIRWFFKNEDVLSFGSEVALIGPKSYGKNVQERYHRTFGFYEVKGWEYQLNNAVGIDLNTSYSHLLFRSQSQKWDSFLNASLSLGLNNTRVSIGPSFRYGRFNPMFESIAMGGKINSKNNKPKKETYFFYRPQINWVIYNSTIQGGMLIKDKGPITYNVMPLVLSQVVGVQWSRDRIGLNFNYTFNTKEVKSAAVPHQYGSLTLSYSF
jgi:hypothetical protein